MCVCVCVCVCVEGSSKVTKSLNSQLRLTGNFFVSFRLMIVSVKKLRVQDISF